MNPSLFSKSSAEYFFKFILQKIINSAIFLEVGVGGGAALFLRIFFVFLFMLKSKYSPTLVTGFALAVLSLIPGFKGIAFIFFFPAAIVLALYLSQKIAPPFSRIGLSDGIIFGLLTGICFGLFSTVFELLSTYFTKSHELIAMLPEMERLLAELNLSAAAKPTVELLHSFTEDITGYGFSPLFSVFIFFNNLFGNVVFGLLFGLLARLIHNSRVPRYEQ
jgi:hypothetical protein